MLTAAQVMHGYLGWDKHNNDVIWGKFTAGQRNRWSSILPLHTNLKGAQASGKTKNNDSFRTIDVDT